MLDWIKRKMERWSAANEEAAERSKARRLLLESAKDEALRNELATARADQILLNAKLAALDKKLQTAEKKLN